MGARSRRSARRRGVRRGGRRSTRSALGLVAGARRCSAPPPSLRSTPCAAARPPIAGAADAEARAAAVAERRRPGRRGRRQSWPRPHDRGARCSPRGAEALVDPVTGSVRRAFFAVTLAQPGRRRPPPPAPRRRRARRGRRPASEGTATPVPPRPVVVADTLRRRCGRPTRPATSTRDRFGLVLEDTPENGAVWTVERVRRALAAERKDLTLWAGVACYPAHAFDADELLARAARRPRRGQGVAPGPHRGRHHLRGLTHEPRTRVSASRNPRP